ncbi:MAG TPA: hypothetical protein VGF76_19645, partial [Polyangiaceae bacterium]
DLKPDNVFVSPDNANWVRISDFGVALLRSASPPPPGWGGTVGWVAPDAADPNARSTPAMDVFSLGLVVFFALSGGALHRAARKTPIDPGALWQELTSPLDSASLRARELGASLDPAFDVWFQRAVAPMPQARFSSVSAMASAFDAIARTLVAPQSQNAVALQGIAAAIAQPLVFQPDAPPPAPPLGYSAPTQQSPVSPAAAPAYAARAEDAPSSSAPGVRKKTAAPLLIGGAVVCFAVTALGVGGLYYHRRAVAEQAVAEASASASAATASAAASAAIAAAAAAPPVPVSAPPTPAAAVPTTTAVTPTQAAAPATAATPVVTALVTPKPAVTAAIAKPAAVSSVVAATKPATVPPAKSATVVPAKAAVTPAPVKAVATAKPTLLVPPKKKCPSTFIPCK